MGFDVGAILANLWLAYFSRDWHGRVGGENPEDYQQWLLEQAAQIWNGFSAKFLNLWRDHESRSKQHFIGKDPDEPCSEAFRTHFMQRILADTLGFAGCKMIRRIVGMAKVAEITSIPDEAERAKIEVRCLRFAEALLVQRQQFGGIDEVLAHARTVRAQRED